MHRAPVAALLLLCLSAAARADRPPLQIDVDRCTLFAEDGGRTNVSGSVRFQLLARPDGKVFAGFVHSEKGLSDRKLERCILYVAMLWRLSPSRLDYSWPYPIAFTPGVADHSHHPFNDPQREIWYSGSGQGRAAAFLPDIAHPPATEPIDAAAAQDTLEIAEWATPAEQGLAELAVRRFPAAIERLRASLESERPPEGLRGLSQALVESGGDLQEARSLAEELIAQDPSSEQGHEALLRVCLAAGDDLCAYREFNRANTAPDLSLRWLALRDELLQPAKAAAARLQAAQRAAPQDPCASEDGRERQALCVVRRCLDEAPDGASAGWRARRGGQHDVVVLRSTSSAADDVWLVRESGNGLVIRPTNPGARQVMLAHNRCR